MALSDAALVLAANAVEGAITHAQLHSGARGSSGTSNVVGTRVAINGTVDADGDITWTNISWTGLSANQTLAEVSYWSASSGGTYYGGATLSGDTSANSVGSFVITSLTENGTAV